MTLPGTPQSVTLERPLTLIGSEQPFAAGVNVIEAEEELLEGRSFSAHRRLQALTHLDRWRGRPGPSQVAGVSRDEFDEAQPPQARHAPGRPPDLSRCFSPGCSGDVRRSPPSIFAGAA